MTVQQLKECDSTKTMDEIFPGAAEFFSMLWRQENVVDYELIHFSVYYHIHNKRIPIGEPYQKLSAALDVLSEDTSVHHEPAEDFCFELLITYDKHPIDKVFFY